MEQVQWCFRLPFVLHDPFVKVLTFSWSPAPEYGSLSADPAKHGPNAEDKEMSRSISLP